MPPHFVREAAETLVIFTILPLPRTGNKTNYYCHLLEDYHDVYPSPA